MGGENGFCYQRAKAVVLQKQHSVVKILRICLTWRFNLNRLSTHQDEKEVVFSSLVRTVAGVALGLCVAACATTTKPQGAEDVVKERAQARWDALVKGDAKTAYGYMSPGSRSIITPEAYAASVRPGFWKSARVEKVECGSAQTCDAAATIEYEYMGKRTQSPLRETWIKEGNDWWYLRK